MAALTVKELPEGDEWLYELKWDGYRACWKRAITLVAGEIGPWWPP
jgi:ATP-dependent DNA ligase